MRLVNLIIYLCKYIHARLASTSEDWIDIGDSWTTTLFLTFTGDDHRHFAFSISAIATLAIEDSFELEGAPGLRTGGGEGDGEGDGDHSVAPPPFLYITATFMTASGRRRRRRTLGRTP